MIFSFSWQESTILPDRARIGSYQGTYMSALASRCAATRKRSLWHNPMLAGADFMLLAGTV
jgi:hypothetical protein